MADISLLFDVAGGESIAEGSGKEIKRQLDAIVGEINKSPLKIKFEADKTSLDNLRAEIEGITKSVGVIGSGGAFNGLDRGVRAVSSTVVDVNRNLKATEASLHSVKASLNSTNVSSLREALSSIEGLQQADASKLADSFKSVNAELTTMKARWEESAKGEQRILQLTVGAKNELGQTLQYLVSFDKKTGEIKRKLVDVSHSFKTVTAEASKTSKSTKGTDDIAKRYQAAIATIKEYYALLKQRDSNPAISADIVRNNGEFVSRTGEYARFADMLNRVSAAFAEVNQSMSVFSNEQKNNLVALRTKELQRYQVAIEKVAVSERKANAAREQSSAKSQTARETSLTNSYNTALIRCEESLKKWTAAEHSKHESSRVAYQALKSSIDGAKAAKNAYETGTGSIDGYSDAVGKMRATLKSTEQTLRANGDATKTLSERLSGLANKFGAWFSVSSIMMAGYRAIRNMVTSVIDLDTAMTELKKVTDETDATYDKFLTNASKRAKDLGATLSDTVTATADFARLGYGIEDAEKLADAAIVYKNVGDGIDDISTASESIIATMQAFSIPAENIMNIVDKFNEVGNRYAISSVGVGDALLRSAAAMNAANNSLDETIALATAANTIVQDPDKVGTVLKTVSMYLRAAKTEAEDAGESTEGMANSVSELRKEILSLTGNKVDIQIDENTFKSTYQILQELSQVWDELTDISQANILEMVGGKRNSNVVAALLENFSIAEASLKTSADSAGSALAENEKYLESIEGKLSQFKATFQDFSDSIINSGLVKFIVDAGSTILNILTKIIDGLGTVPAILGTILAVMSFKKIGRGKMSPLIEYADGYIFLLDTTVLV